MKSRFKQTLITFILLALLFICNSQNTQTQSAQAVKPKPQQATHQNKPEAKVKEGDIIKKQGEPKIQTLEEGKIAIDTAANTINLNPTVRNPSTQTPHTPQAPSQQAIPQQHPDVTIDRPQEPVAQGGVLNFKSGEDTKQFATNLDPLRDNIIQKEEAQIDQQQRQQQQKKIHPWIVQQMELISQANNIKTHEIFSFVLETQSQVQFKWNPTQFKQGPLNFVVEVYDYYRGDVLFPDNPAEDDYIEVFSQPDHAPMFTSLGKVYIKKMFTINFFTDFTLLRLRSHYDRRMFVQISLQATKFIPQSALDDDDLKIPSQKINSILEELEQTEKKRQKTFRQEWSFKDRQEHHQSEMLILTGVQLFVILGTAIVQMYCIKNLFDNRLIV